MKVAAATLVALGSLTTAIAQVDCSKYQFTRQLDPLLKLDYVVNADNDPATFRGRLTYAGLGWVGFGHSPEGAAGMAPGQSVVGSSAGVLKYSHTSRTNPGVNPILGQTLTDTSFEQNSTHTVVEFTKRFEEDDEIPIKIGMNNFIYAYGSGNTLAYHANRGVVPFEIEACVGEAAGLVAEPTTPTISESEPPAAPTSASPTTSTTIAESEAPTDPTSTSPTEPPLAPTSTPSIDCSASTTQFRQLTDELFFEWSLNREDNILSARAILEREAWLAIGVTESAAGSMFPSNAVIGLQDVGLPRKYSIDGRSATLINILSDDRQTLLNSTLEQRNGQTVMVFQKILDEPDEVFIDAEELNTFIFAYGTDNSFGRHTSSDRGSFKIFLDPCADNEEIPDPQPQNSYRGMWTSHGLFAGIAWGILTPLAIASSLLRDMFPAGGVWFTAHFFLNMTTFAFTTIAFGLAVTATQKSTLEGESPNHFVGLAHRSVGLFIMTITLAQVVAGFLRPHPAQKNPDTEVMEEKKPSRFLWEVLHKGFGFGLVAIAWWQCQSGLTLFAQQFGTTDLTLMFLSLVATLTIATALLWTCNRCSKN